MAKIWVCRATIILRIFTYPSEALLLVDPIFSFPDSVWSIYWNKPQEWKFKSCMKKKKRTSFASLTKKGLWQTKPIWWYKKCNWEINFHQLQSFTSNETGEKKSLKIEKMSPLQVFSSDFWKKFLDSCSIEHKWAKASERSWQKIVNHSCINQIFCMFYRAKYE